MNDEVLEIVNENGDIIGSASRNVIHNDNTLLHRVVHLLLFNSGGQLLLQRRSISKDIAPGTWDTSVGGHVNPGEEIRQALFREIKEELSLTEIETEYLYSYIHRNETESELVYSFRSQYDGVISFNDNEISDITFRDAETIVNNLQEDIFSEHFRDEFQHYVNFLKETK